LAEGTRYQVQQHSSHFISLFGCLKIKVEFVRLDTAIRTIKVAVHGEVHLGWSILQLSPPLIHLLVIGFYVLVNTSKWGIIRVWIYQY